MVGYICLLPSNYPKVNMLDVVRIGKNGFRRHNCLRQAVSGVKSNPASLSRSPNFMSRQYPR